MLRVGLTGGVGSGKSAVTDQFEQLGVPVIDADLAAREVVKPGQPALDEIAKRFGRTMVQADGTLDRKRLRDLVFQAPQERKALEAILHPRIRSHMRSQAADLNTPYVIFSVPLLLETGQQDDFDRILVIDCSIELQISRVSRRDQVSHQQAEAIVASQTSRAARLAAADDIIENSGSIEDLVKAVEKLHLKYLKLAES